MPCCSRPRRAARSYTGADCSLAQCADTLHWISAGALLVESNWPEPLRDMATAKTTWANIFRAADLDGNEFLTLAEATRGTELAAMSVDGAITNIWSWLVPTSAQSTAFEVLSDAGYCTNGWSLRRRRR